MNNYEKFGLKSYGAIPNERQMEWYNREKMIFFHFGMNTFTNKEWGDGNEDPKTFNPTDLDVRSWVRLIRDAGFKCAILTAKHHDGFCLWQTKWTEHSIKNSLYKNGKGDIVREFTDACREYGIKAGIYLSPWDRHEKTWGKDEYNDFYVGQLTELFTNYGKIWECWWDGAGSTEAVYDWERWAKTVKTLQPDATIFGSLGATPWVDVRWVGNEKGIAGKPCYATIDSSSLVYEYTNELNSGKIGGERFIPAEVDVSIRPGWFYHSEQDKDVRTPENLINLFFTSNGSNAGFLLNLPPDRRGLIHENDQKSLLEFNRILTKALSNNYVENAKITATTERHGCEAQNLKNIDPVSIYAPLDTDKCPEILIELPCETEINAIMISELIELGHKIVGIEAYALENGEWKQILNSEIVGYKLCEKFDNTVTDKVKIKITKSLDTPAIRSVGLYRFEQNSDTASKNIKKSSLLENESAQVVTDKNSFDINLGGVYSFDEITLEGAGECTYSVSVFNGSSFENLTQGKSDTNDLKIVFDSEIDWAYRIKLTLDKEVTNDMKLTVK